MELSALSKTTGYSQRQNEGREIFLESTQRVTFLGVIPRKEIREYF